MKVISGHSPASYYYFSFIKKLLPGFLLYFIFPLTASSQDSLQLRSFKRSNIHYLPLVFANGKLTTGQQPAKKGPYLVTQNIRFRADTAAISERYVPGANPRLIWNLSYPLTEDQRRVKAEEQRMEEQIGRQIANEVIQTIFSRKKIPAVKPTF